MSTLLLLGATVLMLTLMFPPFYCFFFAVMALVPFAICVLRRPLNAKYLLAYYLAGVVYFAIGFFWIWPVSLIGLLLLSLYLGVYFPLFAFGFHRITTHLRLPSTVALPLVWTSLEYVRATFLEGGCPWFLAGNALTPLPVLIQSADLFGVWGLTFLIGMVNGLAVDILRLPLFEKDAAGKPGFSRALLRLTTAVMAIVLVHLGYGIFRLRQETVTPGPRIAVIQENFAQSVKEDPDNAARIFQSHFRLASAAAQQMPRPDLIAWPETMITDWLNKEFLAASPAGQERFFAQLSPEKNRTFIEYRQEDSRIVLDALDMLTSTYAVPQLIGYSSIEPKGTYEASIKQNRTALIMPGSKERTEYAKRHLVPFGEYIPFRHLPIIGKWMVLVSPNGMDFSNERGEEWTRFTLPLRLPPDASAGPEARNSFTFATPICFEDAMPRPSREMTAPQFDPSGQGRKTDFLINVSNDGWFHWVELDQHLQACQLRAVENRVPIARAVNTGNSGFIDSNGRIMGLVMENGRSIGAKGTLAMQMPVDSRVTLFSKVGDLLPISCGIVTTLLVGWTLVRPRRASGGRAGA